MGKILKMGGIGFEKENIHVSNVDQYEALFFVGDEAKNAKNKF